MWLPSVRASKLAITWAMQQVCEKSFAAQEYHCVKVCVYKTFTLELYFARYFAHT